MKKLIVIMFLFCSVMAYELGYYNPHAVPKYTCYVADHHDCSSCVEAVINRVLYYCIEVE